jgi:cytochrome c-type biogenesis protein CcmH
VTTFLIVVVLMVAAALGWILVPLLRPAAGKRIGREASNVAILRDQLAELDGDLAAGTTTREQYDEARRELERRVLEESTAAQSSAPVPSPSAAWTAALVGSAIPLVALVLYATIGNVESLLPGAKRDVASGPSHEVTREQVEEMAAKLATKLEKDPDNVDGWVMLARTYYALQRNADANKAFERAAALRPDDAGLLADFADALASTQGGIAGQPLMLVERALKIDPTHWKALALAGTAAFDRKDYKQAVAYWEKMKATVPSGSPIAASIDNSIAEARALGGLSDARVPPPAASNADASKSPASALKPVEPVAQSAATGGKPAAATSTSIVGTVALAPALEGKVAPTDTVYIFARAAEGPRMPLAILRKQVKDLPVTFALDDSMAMSPNFALSNFPSVVVGARISKSGNAAPQSGDLEGISPTVKVGMTGVSVVIDRAVP